MHVRTIVAISLGLVAVGSALMLNPHMLADAQLDENTKDELQIKAVFYLPAGTEEINNFKVYNQISGFQKKTLPTFELEGEIDFSSPLLRKLVRQSLTNPENPDTQNFKASIQLYDENREIKFTYNKCKIMDYHVRTYYDQAESYADKEEFSYVENYKFECSGFSPHEQLKKSQKSNDTIRPETKESQTKTWEDYFD